jgi:hypothetical protein
MDKNGYEIKKRIVESGESKVFKEWQKYGHISKWDFLAALEWVCMDQLDKNNRLTRIIGLEQGKIVKLSVIHDAEITLYKLDNDFAWDGAVFKIPAETEKEKLFADEDGMILQNFKITLSARDNV